ncbi:helix-turn-helix domain-containing protein [Mycobacterium sp. PDNC021]|uniref:helix-turn-helix domain-containing protein n=1 Tax=Mycobacterium sp. PDNC021 TaxID=3391399 RepID=UPI003AAD968F
MKMIAKAMKTKGRSMQNIMTAKQLAAELHVSEDSLAQDRYKGGGIPFVKVGSRVRYMRVDVEAFLAANRCTRTDDPRGAA